MGRPYSRTNFWGDIEHYDGNGNKIGESRRGFFEGEYVDYDAHGHKTGTSREQIFGVGYNHYDNAGHKIGSSDEGFFGGYTNRDEYGRVTGYSERSFFDLREDGINKNNGSSYVGNRVEDRKQQGCYIATCVYGSYDCPEVWVLRRFRDFCLAESTFGRAFIRIYYRFSPGIVKRFGGNRIFRRFWKAWLDRMVAKLQEAGYESGRYED